MVAAVAAEHAKKPAVGGGVCRTALHALSCIIFTTFTPMWETIKSLLVPEKNKWGESEEIPVLGLMEKQELSKAIFQLGVTLNVGVVALRREKLHSVEQLIVVANAVGCALIFNGLLLRECTPTFARTAELMGVGLVFVNVHLLFSIHVTAWWLRILLALCCAFCMRPLVMAELFSHSHTKNSPHISGNDDNEAVITLDINHNIMAAAASE